MSSSKQSLDVRIRGMTCDSCVLFIEETWQELPGVQRVSVDRTQNRAHIEGTTIPSIETLHTSVKERGYTIHAMTPSSASKSKLELEAERKTSGKRFLEAGIAVLAIFLLWKLLSALNLIPTGVSIPSNVGFGLAFVMGLVASVSTCMATAGGLLMGVSARMAKRDPDATGFKRLRPHLVFNTGRVGSYAVMGAITGSVGSAFALSPKLLGLLVILASIGMVGMGLQLLGLFPSLARFLPRTPKKIAKHVQRLGGKNGKTGPFLLGAATFFLPCGFTQALQLYVLSTADPLKGAGTMFFFALGTVPALLAIGAAASFTRGSLRNVFLKLSGAAVLVLGIVTMSSGWTLTGGATANAGSLTKTAATNLNGGAPFRGQKDSMPPLLPIIDGKQQADMSVKGFDYTPYQFAVRQGVPVEWHVDGSGAQGCAQVLIAPEFKVTALLKADQPNVIAFTPQKVGTFGFSCSMGMTNPDAAFIVVPSDTPAPNTSAGTQPSA